MNGAPCAALRAALLGELDLVPERVERGDARVADRDPALAGERFDRLESARELVGGTIERERGMHAGAAAEIDHREEQVAQLILEVRLRARGAGRSDIALLRELPTHLR